MSLAQSSGSDVSHYREFKPYLASFIGFDRVGVRRTVALNFAVASLEGVGLLLLIPLLGVAEVIGSSPAVIPAWLHPLADRVAVLPPNFRLAALLATFVLLIAVQSGLILLRDRQAQGLQLRFVDHLRATLYRGIAAARWSFLTQHHSGELLSVLTTDVQRVGVGTHFLLQLFTTLVMFAVYLAVALQLSAPVAALALVAGGWLWWLLRQARAAARHHGRLLSEANQGMFMQIQEFLTGLKLIKIHGEEAVHTERFLTAVDALRERQIEFQRVRTLAQMGFRVGGAALLSGLTFAAFEWVRVPAANLLVMIAVFARMLPQLAGLHGSLQQIAHMLPAFTHWRDWVDRCAAHAEPPGVQAPVGPVLQGLVLSGVVHRHPEGHHVLRIPALMIPARKTTAIVGATGSGKTTLLDLISGVIVPDCGVVTADGQPLALRPGWRRSLAYVPQENTIFAGTLRDNLTWGNAPSDDGEIFEALRQAAVAKFVRALPEGLDTRVGERGIRLSGGERQRIALARALLRRPELLVLDEATNAVDGLNQRLILGAIRALHGRMTVLIVTHRHDELSGLIDGRVDVARGQVGPWEPVSGASPEPGPHLD